MRTGGTDLLVDPWLFGSCYWRSWWHFPPLEDIEDAWLTPRYIYLSHHHFDHFHYPSLRRVHREAEVLVPEFGVDVMRTELASLGFHHVTELAHGVPKVIGDAMEVRSYQYGVDDSALVVRGDQTVVADLNDCKVRGGALRQIVRDVGRPTFMLKNYSAAQAYPGCYRAEDARDLNLISRQTYMEDFVQTARDLAPRYAVPFASMTCFLHPETQARNADIVLPRDVADFFQRKPVTGTELVLMSPGDTWDEAEGFRIASQDPYANFQESLVDMAERVRPSIDAALTEEASHRLTFEDFERYFQSFVDSLPPLTTRLFQGAVIFQGSGPDDYWVIDVRHRRVTRSSVLPADWATLVRTPPGVLADAMAKRIVNFIHISMRLTIELNQGGTHTDFLFWGVLTIFELGYLPLHKLPMRRAAWVGWRRRREMWGSLRLQLAGKGSTVERMASSLMPTGGEPEA
jgi:UDP-MurNAc hydroxylase